LRNLHEPTYSFVILTFNLIIVDTLLAWFSIRISEVGAAGASWFLIVVAFMILFTLLVSMVPGAYVGTLVGSGIFALDHLFLHASVAIIWAIAGLISVPTPS
jgi:hypothetical protein